MATQQATIDYILKQLSELEGVSARKMFGEYALYYDDKVVALVCDDMLFVKPTAPGFAFVPESSGAPPYPSAKKYLPVPDERLTDKAWLASFLQATAAALPKRKPKQ